MVVSQKEGFRLSENLMRIERRAHLHYAALFVLTMLTLVEKIPAAGVMPQPRVNLLAETRHDCQQQEPERKDEYAEMATAIYERAAPAVVSIHAVSINPYRLTERVEHSVGSGFIIDPGGLALTNSHVVFGRQSLVVRLNDGTELPAQLIGADPILDIAVLRIPKLKQNVANHVKPHEFEHRRPSWLRPLVDNPSDFVSPETSILGCGEFASQVLDVVS